jgi:branched-chain amino acid transport system substrate-binding protein
MRRSFLRVAIASLALTPLLLGGAAAFAQQPIRLALVVPNTGPFAVLGTSQQQGATLAVEEINAKGGINGRKIELVVEDTSASPTTAVTALRRALGGKPVAVLGPIIGTQVLAMSPEIQKEGAPFLVIPGTVKVTQIGNPWLFRFQVTDMVARRVVTKFSLERLRKNKIGILHVNDEYGIGGRDATIELLKNEYKLVPVAVEAYGTTDRDVSAQLLKIKNAGADVLHVQGNSGDIAVVIKQIRQLKIDIPVIASTGLVAPATLKLLEPEELNGIYVETAGIPALDPDPRVKEWMKAYEARWQRAPDWFAMQDYDAVMTLAAIMRAKGPDREAIRKALREEKFQGLAGEVVADKEGNMYHTSRIYRFEGKTPKLLETIALQPQR